VDIPFILDGERVLQEPPRNFSADRLGLGPAALTPEKFRSGLAMASFVQVFSQFDASSPAVRCPDRAWRRRRLAGYAWGRYEFAGKKAVMGILVASMAIPLGFSIIPIYQLLRMLRLTNTLAGLVLAESGGANIVFILLFAGFFKQVPKELEEAAIIDAATFPTIFRKIILPLSQPIIGSVTIMHSIWSWNSFMLPLVSP
jgi:hypothetical protein